MKQNRNISTWVAVLITAMAPIIWGSTYLVTTELLPVNRPLLAAVVRAVPAGVILVMMTGERIHGRWLWRIFLLGLLNIGVFFYCLFLAAYHLPGGVAALVMSSQPIIVLTLSFFILKQRATALHLIACAMAVLGVALVALRPEAKLSGVGVIAGLAGALSMSLGIILAKRWGRPDEIGVMTYTGYQLIIGGVALLPIMLFSEGVPESISKNNVIGFGYLIFVGSVLAYSLWFRGMEQLTAVSMSFISLASPLSAGILGLVFLGQRFSVVQLIGVACIIGSVVLSQKKLKN